MKSENDKALCDKWPLIFADRNKSIAESCMYWGLAVGEGWYNLIDNACAVIQGHIDWSIKSRNIDIEHNKIVRDVREGDYTLFNKRFAKIEEKWRKQQIDEMLAVANDSEESFGKGIRPVPEIIPQFVADQVKEKFGGLRFYYHGGDEFCNGVVQMAEAMSTCICEQCGAPGKIGGRGWIKTLCTPCRENINKEQYSHHKTNNLSIEDNKDSNV